jgi:L-aspartate oxidase
VVAQQLQNGVPSTLSGLQGAKPAPVETYDFLVLGSGIAGLSYALQVAEYGSVAIVTKDRAEEGCTTYAQGGVCAVLDPFDSVDKHAQDTMIAGGYLNVPEAVDAVCREGPKAVLELAQMGAEFTRNQDGSLHLTREGGHSERRIVHAADVTGREIERALVAAAAANPNITFFEHHLATDLLYDKVNGVRHCLGADVLDQQAQAMIRFVAPVTMLATGGAGQVYPNTTNPHVTTGDGMAMAFRARAVVSNLEFVQFHPTGLYDASPVPGKRAFLISEAVRGEGGLLYNQSMERFMPKYDDRLELAPRDVVARSIYDQMLQRDETHVLLDISHKPTSEVLHHFPNIAAQCKKRGIEITQEPIPVVPTQHYMCGGVQTGLLGETNIAGLYACGEVACTGLHGANRLASNSLLEGLVFANRAVEPSVSHAEYAFKYASQALSKAANAAYFTDAQQPRQLSQAASAWVAAKRRELGSLMWGNAGILRRTADMQAALTKLTSIATEVNSLSSSYGVNTELVELRNLVTVGQLIMASALQRKESRGLHYCLDYPELSADLAKATVINSSSATSKKRYDLSNSQVVPRNNGRRSFNTSDSKRVRELSMRSQREE